MTECNAEEILLKMASLLEESGVLEKRASGSELNGIAGSMMVIADHLDAVGADIAASRLDSALEKLARVGCHPDVPSADSVAGLDRETLLKAASTILIGVADRLDGMESEAAYDVDRALEALAGRCMCPCVRCAAAMGPKGHCGNADTKCHIVESGGE